MWVVCFVIAKTVSNQRMKSSPTSFLNVTIAIRAMICSNVQKTAVSLVKITILIIGFIITKSISNKGIGYSITGCIYNTRAVCAKFSVDTWSTTIPSVIIAFFMICFIIAKTITYQFSFMTIYIKKVWLEVIIVLICYNLVSLMIVLFQLNGMSSFGKEPLEKCSKYWISKKPILSFLPFLNNEK